MNDATQPAPALDDTQRIDCRFYPPTVEQATAWHRYRLTHRGRIIRDMVAGAAVLSVAVFAQPISVSFFTLVEMVGHLAGTA